MPLLVVRALTRPAVAGAVAALTLLPACGSPPATDGVAPILLTEEDGTTRGPDVGARPVELPDPARAGDADDDVPGRREPAPQPDGDDDAADRDRDPGPPPPPADDTDDDDAPAAPADDPDDDRADDDSVDDDSVDDSHDGDGDGDDDD